MRGELIGKGTYGRVYLALNATTGEMIAVKQVEIPRTASDKDDSRQVTVVEALKLESETLKDLDHPNIVSYLGFEETPTFLSMCVTRLQLFVATLTLSIQLFGVRSWWLDRQLSPQTRTFRRGSYQVVHWSDLGWSRVPSL